ncbi:MAG: hypothetical protein AB2L24_09440 [Mangrovibacterium sp.]
MKQIINEQKPDNPGRIARLVKKLDMQDKDLDPKKRKRKWIFVLSGLFLLYLISFLFPMPELSHKPLGPEEHALLKDTALPATPNSPAQKSMTFEMPVDSFENLLKQHIHEGNLKKK